VGLRENQKIFEKGRKPKNNAQSKKQATHNQLVVIEEVKVESARGENHSGGSDASINIFYYLSSCVTEFYYLYPPKRESEEKATSASIS
jgi:hypothetical protein